MYVILWEMRNYYINIDSWKIQNASILYFWKNSPKNGQIFQLVTLYSKGCHFSITKLAIVIFGNILHLEIEIWNLSWKRIVFPQTFWQKSRKKYYKWDIEKNGITYSAVRNLKQPTCETCISIRITYSNKFRIISKIEALIFPSLDKI